MRIVHLPNGVRLYAVLIQAATAKPPEPKKEDKE